MVNKEISGIIIKIADTNTKVSKFTIKTNDNTEVCLSSSTLKPKLHTYIVGRYKIIASQKQLTRNTKVYFLLNRKYQFRLDDIIIPIDKEFISNVKQELYDFVTTGQCLLDWLDTNFVYPEVRQNLIKIVAEDDYQRMIDIGETPGEKQCNQALKQLYPQHQFIKTRPDFLINPKTGRRLELDLYCPELNIAIEYNDSRHYKVRKQIKNDKTKHQICTQKKIILIDIPYTLKDIPSYLYSFLISKIESIDAQ